MPESKHPGRIGASRQIALALVASVAIHALIIVLAPGLKDPARQPRADPLPLIAHLMAQHATPEPPLRVADVRQPSPDKARRPERPVAHASPPPPPLILAQSPRSAETPVQLQSQATVSVPLAQSVQPVAQRTEPALVGKAALVAQSVTTAPAADAEAIDSASLGQYRSALIAAARPYRKYPRVAVENNWEGRAEVRLTIDSNGSIGSISIRTRSGYEVLDAQALEMIRKAKPMAPVPQGLRGKGFTLDLPILFSLKEETG